LLIHIRTGERIARIIAPPLPSEKIIATEPSLGDVKASLNSFSPSVKGTSVGDTRAAAVSLLPSELTLRSNRIGMRGLLALVAAASAWAHDNEATSITNLDLGGKKFATRLDLRYNVNEPEGFRMLVYVEVLRHVRMPQLSETVVGYITEQDLRNIL